MIAVSFQCLLVLSVERVFPHIAVHRRGKEHLGPGSHKRRGQEVVSNTIGHFTDEVGGGWSNQEKISTICQ